MSKFFDTIYGGGQGYISISGRNAEGELNVERWIKWPDSKSFVDRYVNVRQDEDVYYSVSMFSNERRVQTDDLAETKLVWADADICPPEKFRLPPSIIVQTSPAHGPNDVCTPRDRSGKPCEGHYHVLWLLDRFYPAREAQEASRKIAVAHSGDGCDRGWSMTKILRVPGTTNTKYVPPYTIPDADYTDHVYSLEEVLGAYSDITDKQVLTFDGPVPEIISEDDLGYSKLEDYVNRAGITDLYLMKPQEGQSWSERAYRMQMELFRFGLDPEEVFAISWNAACNKYHPRAAGEKTQSGVTIPLRENGPEVLWTEVRKAEAEYQLEVTPTQQEAVVRVAEKELELLTPDERALVADNPTVIDDYVNWALSRSPDHAPTYSYSLGYMLLSTAYADRVRTVLLWDEPRPNLWLFVLGDSTRTHKSAAKNLFLRFVHALEDQEMEELDIGSDATAEALLKVLSERNGQVSLLHTDEINGFFRENMTKNYRAGTLETYTKLYDGHVDRVLRASKDSGNERRAETAFNLLGVGIFDQTAEALTRDQFASGFLTRGLWSIAESRAYQPGDSDLVNGTTDLDTVSYADLEFNRILGEIIRVRSKYDPEKPLRLTFSHDALARINHFTDSLHRYAQSVHDRILDAGIDRLRDSVMKAATLLSYHNGNKRIELFETLVAIRQGELWFNDFKRMLNAVSTSAFGAKCDEMEMFISTGPNHSRTEAAVLKRFQYKLRDYGEIRDVLVRQGRVRMHGKKGLLEAIV